MFDFAETARKKRVGAVLSRRLNSRCLDELWGAERGASRALYVQTVSVVPRDSKKKWQFANAFPAVTVNISTVGIAVIHFEEATNDLLVGLSDDKGDAFIHCEQVHAKPIGHGFFLFGLRGVNVIELESADRHELNARMADFEDGTSISQQALRSLFGAPEAASTRA